MTSLFPMVETTRSLYCGSIPGLGTATAAPQKPSSTKDLESRKFKILPDDATSVLPPDTDTSPHERNPDHHPQTTRARAAANREIHIRPRRPAHVRLRRQQNTFRSPQELQNPFYRRWADAFRVLCALHGPLTPFHMREAARDVAVENKSRTSDGEEEKHAPKEEEATAASGPDALLQPRGNVPMARRYELKYKDTRWRKGDAFIFDSRLMRRHLSSDSFHRTAPMLVLRYDRSDVSAAPNQNVQEMYRNQLCGRLLDRVFSLYAWL